MSEEKFNKVDSAKFLLKLIDEKLEIARKEHLMQQADLSSAYQANESYKKSVEEEERIFPSFGPSGNREPYNSQSLSNLGIRSKNSTQIFNDWQNVKKWYIEDLLEKYVK